MILTDIKSYFDNTHTQNRNNKRSEPLEVNLNNK